MARKTVKEIGIACLALLGLGAIGAYVTSGAWGPVMDASNDLDAALAKAKAAGLPMTSSELNPKPPVPEIENAAPVLMELEVAIEVDSDYEKGSRDFNSEEGKRLLKRTMLLITKLARFKRMDRKLDWDMGPAMLIRGGMPLRFAAKAHQFQAIQAAKRGDHKTALQHIADADNLVSLLYGSPIQIDALIAKAIDAINSTTVVRVAELWEKDRIGLELLRDRPASAELTPYARTLNGEFFVGLVITRNHVSPKDLERMMASEGEPVLSAKTVKRSGFPTSPLHRANLAVFANTMAGLKQFCTQNSDPQAVIAELDRIRSDGPTTFANAMTRILLPMQATVEAYDRSTVFSEMRDAVIKLHLYRLKSGRFPATLAEAGITIIDPFTGKSVIYKSKQDEFVIYSVGSDRIDAGGPGQVGDHGFTYPSRPARP